MVFMKACVKDDKRCDICGGSLFRKDRFYNARTVSGQWAWLCKMCFLSVGKGLGTGRGQEYDSETKEKLRG